MINSFRQLPDLINSIIQAFSLPIIDIFQGTAGFRQPVAHSVNMSVIQPHGGKNKFPSWRITTG